MTKYVCGGGCGKRVIRPEGPLSMCGACFFLDEVLQSEGCDSVAHLLSRRDFVLARVADVLRRSGVEDAEELIATLSK